MPALSSARKAGCEKLPCMPRKMTRGACSDLFSGTDSLDNTDSSIFARTTSLFYTIGTSGRLAHKVRNEVAPWRESAPGLLSFTPREKAGMDRGFLVSCVGNRLGEVLPPSGRLQVIFAS